MKFMKYRVHAHYKFQFNILFTQGPKCDQSAVHFIYMYEHIVLIFLTCVIFHISFFKNQRK